MASDNVVSMKENGLNAIFSKLEAEMELHDALRLLWKSYEDTPHVDELLSAIYRTDHRALSIDDVNFHQRTELKINIISSAYSDFTGKDRVPRYVDDKEIVAQIVVVANNEHQNAVVSEVNPAAAIKRFAAMYNWDWDVGIIRFFVLYAHTLHGNGFRVASLEVLNKNDFYLELRQGNVSVRLIIYYKDFINARFYLAHLNKMLQEPED